MKGRNLSKIVRSFPGGYCGFSGGADSTALLLALYQAKIDVTAVHFHHGLRGESADGDAVWCQAFCAERGIPFLCIHLEVPKHRQTRESCEQCARRLRLEQWRNIAGEKPVYLAHHADDLMENLFLRLGRGTGWKGLLGMKAECQVEGVRLIRPFLSLRKRELENWLVTQNIAWRTDETNAQCFCRRNAIRNRLLPLFREIFGNDRGLARTLENLRDGSQEKGKEASPPNPNEMNSAQEKHAKAQTSPVLWNWREMPMLAWGDWGVLKIGIGDGDKVVLTAEQKENCKSEEFAMLPCPLLVRCWTAGDKLQPFGTAHHCKLQDLFTNSKISREERNRWPVIEDGHGTILLLPLIRRAEYGRL